LVAEILRAAPAVRILVTSRARLNVEGESLYPVAGMKFPGQEALYDAIQYSAVKLFLQSARRVRPGFELAAADLKYVARICRLVQGMPLGILLAAGWLEMLAPAEIAAEIGRSLDFLETDLRDVPERQRSMRAVFDHSWGLLTEREQEVLQGLSVFRGGFTREAAQEVTGASLRELMALVNKSLLGREPGGRYGIHELLRQFATEYLNASEEADGARLRHREFYLALAEDAEPELEGPEPAVWMSRLDAEHDNLRAALAWSLDRADGVALRLAGALGWFWRSRGQHAEGRDWLTRALARSVEHGDGLDQHRAKALCLAGELAWCQSDYEVAATLEAESARLYRATGDKGGLGGALTMWAAVAYQQRDLTRARALVEESIALLRQTDDRLILAKALFWRGHLAYSGGDYNTAAISAKESMKLAQAIGALNWIAGPTSTLGRIALDHGDYAAAQSFYGTSLAAYRQAENKVGVSIVLRCLAVLSYAQGRYDSAGAFYKENLELAQETGDKRTSAWALNCLGYVALKLNDRCEAQTRFVEGLALFLSLEDREGTAACLIPLAELRAEGEPEVAAWLLGSAHATVTRIEKRSPSVALVEFQAEYGRTAAEVEAQLGEAAFANAWAEGRKLELEATAAELLRELGE
jgi:predicted ATPase